MKKRVKRVFKTHKFISIIILLALLSMLFLIGARLYLYFQFMLGNDLIIRIDAEQVSFSHSDSQKNTFHAKIYSYTNFFCHVNCSLTLEDISDSMLIKTEEFELGTLARAEKLILETSKENKIYQIRLSCHNQRSFFCDTEESPVTKTVLITSNYVLNESQQKQRDEILLRIESVESEKCIKNLEEEYILNSSAEINKRFSFEFSPDLEDFSLNKTILLIEENELDLAIDSLNQLEIRFKEARSKTESKLREMTESVSLYNSLVENITQIKLKIGLFAQGGVENPAELIKTIEEFNNKSEEFSSTNNLTEKANISFNANLSIFSISDTGTAITKSLFFNETKISLGLQEFKCNKRFPISAKERCCIYKVCRYCEENKTKNYPVIFLHGHAFNKDVSAEYSIMALSRLQRALEPEILNAGELSMFYPLRNPNLLEKINYQVSYSSTYYYDSFKNYSSYIPIQAKSGGIDSYALRIKTIIERAKQETGKDKVIIIAHSMGGLVARRYIQIFGGSSVDKMILIATPNNGIEGDSKNYCAIFGSQEECEDMYSESLFLNKLNAEISEPKIFNIIGTGCSMKGGEGDGIVLEKNARLASSTEYIINGSCSGLNFLHTEIIGPEKYPKTEELIKSILQDY